jgi:hypothetical protein
MESCSGCKDSAARLLEAGVEFETYDIEQIGIEKVFKFWKHRLGESPNSVPQFWYKGKYIGNSKNIENFVKEKNVT